MLGVYVFNQTSLLKKQNTLFVCNQTKINIICHFLFKHT